MARTLTGPNGGQGNSQAKFSFHCLLRGSPRRESLYEQQINLFKFHDADPYQYD